MAGSRRAPSLPPKTEKEVEEHNRLKERAPEWGARVQILADLLWTDY